MNLINRGRPNEHHDTICMLNLQGIARFMVAIFIFLLISMSFFLSIWHSWYGFRDRKKFKGNLMEWSKKTITLMSCLFEVFSWTRFSLWFVLPFTASNIVWTEREQHPCYSKRRVWRYKRGNQNPNIKEEQTTQRSKEKVQKKTQRSTN
jgi:hypothetical protein